jgi:arginine exporter protein ArgO
VPSVLAAGAAGLVAGLGVAMPLGAIGVLLVGLPARAGQRVAAAAALGVASTDGLYAAVAVLAGASVAEPLHRVARPLQTVSAGVLVALAVMTFVMARRPARASGSTMRLTAPRAYFGFLALTAVNPATLAYFVALVVGNGGRWTSSAGAWFIAGVLLASAAWQLLLVGGGAALARVLTTPRGRLALGCGSALVMLLLAARVAVYALD